MARSASLPLVTGRGSNPRVDRIPASNRRFSTVSSTSRMLGGRGISGFDIVHLVECFEQPVVLELVGDPTDVLCRIAGVRGNALGQLVQRSRSRLKGGLAQLVGKRSGNLP